MSVNDNFADALTLAFPSTVSGDNTGDTREVGEPVNLIDGGANQPLNTVWWKFIPTQTGVVKIKRTVGIMDHKMVLYKGTAFANLVQIQEAVLNDATGANPRIIAFVCAGEQYYLQFGNQASGPGSFTLDAVFELRTFTTGWLSAGWTSYDALMHGIAQDQGGDFPAMLGTDLAFDEVQGGAYFDQSAIGRVGARLHHWGGNERGTRGDGTVLVDPENDIIVLPQEITALPDIASYDLNWVTVLALTASGDLYGWGAVGGTGAPWPGGNNNGNITTPTLTKTGVTHYAIGNSSAVCRTSDGKIWHTGSRFWLSPITQQEGWADITGSLPTNVSAIYHGPSDAFIRLSTGAIWAMGRNFSGQQGRGNTSVVTTWSDTGQTADSMQMNHRGAYWVRGTAVYYSGESVAPFNNVGTPPTTPRLMDLLPPISKLATVPIDGSGDGLALTAAGDVYVWGAQGAIFLTQLVADPYFASSPTDGYAVPQWGDYQGGPRPIQIPSDWLITDISCGDYASFLRIQVLTPLDELCDDFEDGLIHPQWALTQDGGPAVETSGKIDTGGATLYSSEYKYKLHNSHFAWYGRFEGAQPGTGFGFYLFPNGDSWQTAAADELVEFQFHYAHNISDLDIYCYSGAAYVLDQFSPASYTLPIPDVWIRVRDTGTDLVVDYATLASPDPLNPAHWTTICTFAGKRGSPTVALWPEWEPGANPDQWQLWQVNFCPAPPYPTPAQSRRFARAYIID